MAGYSPNPLFQKLGIKENHRVTLLNAPEGLKADLEPLPKGVKIIGVQKPMDVVLFFPKSLDDLQTKFSKLAEKLAPAGGLWICWPKKASGVPTDMDENKIREVGLAAGLVDNKVCAVSEIFSGLRFVIRVENR